MPKRADTCFHDDELLATLPNASFLIHVDDNKAPWTSAWVGSKVDWAWQEPGGFYLCELKDPECAGAVANPRPAGQLTHVAATVAKLTNASFPNDFAKNVVDTLANQPHAQSASNLRYIVVAAISHKNFNSTVALPASDVIKKHLLKMGLDIPVAVLNIDAWNSQLAPRTLKRVP